ncbi:MAG: DUF1800 family protein [Pseudomonadota bacterium]
MPKNVFTLVVMLLVAAAQGCGGGGSEEPSPRLDGPAAPTPPSPGSPGGALPPLTTDDATIVRFLNRSTFGATQADVSAIASTSTTDWFIQELLEPASYLMPSVQNVVDSVPEPNDYLFAATTAAFWRNAIAGPDQLRQRMAFALSQIFVVSNGVGDELSEHPEAVSTFQDILIRGAFGNYRDLMEAVTYSPAMAYYLTYLGNLPGDAATGRKPDENYARELLQLFSIGVVELNPDGSERLDGSGRPIESYGNADIEGLARVFTGLNLNEAELERSVGAAYSVPLWIFGEDHSQREKRFLGAVIPPGTEARASIDQALDVVFAHPNVGPFVGRQLIQRLVTSNPSGDYVTRVAAAFDRGQFTLPNGELVGVARRGDLTATLAAVLFDLEASTLDPLRGGKLREPVLRFTQWARAFDAAGLDARYVLKLWDTSSATALGQHPYRSPSVFNFFRPGYRAPGSLSGAAGLVAPELQITNATTVPGYINFMTYFVFGQQASIDVDALRETYQEFGIPLAAEDVVDQFRSSYAREQALAADPDALVAHLDVLLTGGVMTADSRRAISELVAATEGALLRSQLAVLLVMTSPDYLVQR